MKNVNFAINGLGRIGKLLFRALFDKGLSIKLVNKTHVKVYAWYDNEWGYVNRLADIASMVGKSIC